MQTRYVWVRALLVLVFALSGSCSAIVGGGDDDDDDSTDKDTSENGKDTTNPGPIGSCEGDCADEMINECTCAPVDPCGWSNDGVCDRDLCLTMDQEMFDDWDDCKDNIYDIIAVTAEILEEDPNGNPWDPDYNPPDPYLLVSAGPSHDIFGFTDVSLDSYQPKWNEWLFDAQLWEFEGTWLIQIWDEDNSLPSETDDYLIGECEVTVDPNLFYHEALVVVDECGQARNLYFSATIK